MQGPVDLLYNHHPKVPSGSAMRKSGRADSEVYYPYQFGAAGESRHCPKKVGLGFRLPHNETSNGIEAAINFRPDLHP
jgi:hypothetical protein